MHLKQHTTKTLFLFHFQVCRDRICVFAYLLHVYANVHMCTHTCKGLRLMSGLILCCSSTFIHQGRSQSNPELTNVSSLASQLALGTAHLSHHPRLEQEGLHNYPIFTWVLGSELQCLHLLMGQAPRHFPFPTNSLMFCLV